jgi:hypothetical protein
MQRGDKRNRYRWYIWLYRKLMGEAKENDGKLAQGIFDEELTKPAGGGDDDQGS